MESTQNIDSAPLLLEEPHFEDELTQVTAQPVVSLEAIAHEQSVRKRWLLAGAFALSLLLGAGSALLAIRIKRQVAQPATVETAVEEVVPEDSASIQGGDTPALAKSSESEPLKPMASEPEEDVAPVVAVHRSERAKKTAAPQRNTSKNQPVNTPEVKNNPARLVDQWEERRSRRVSRRDRRERRQQQNLFRIGEIFEGSRTRRGPD